ncbi:MAG: 5-(carboxyamino)imidazole ribonucleotide synthase [Burkholderiales bacterium]|nr:5-(carboxyamino)imidazole ribonucleotide synthase [Burkholderiales bacterium]
MQNIIIPPSCIGIVGGGQLGRMLAIAAKQMGYAVAILEPDLDCPAHKFADYHIQTKYDDIEGLKQLAQIASVITTEFENVPATSFSFLNKINNAYPNEGALLIAQNRISEKQFFRKNNINTAEYQAIDSTTNFNDIASTMFPGILKTATLGYDGKGQIKVNNVQELKTAFIKLNQVNCILEKLVTISKEVSIIVARNSKEKITYPIVENIHHNGILDLSIAPASITPKQAEIINNNALLIIEQLNYIGVLTIEFFISSSGEIIANEMAPRPHNSGHYTIDCCYTSQFEQQLRAICNLKLGSVELSSNAIMLNLLGDIWLNANKEPDFKQILQTYSNLKLHLYEKNSARNGRKMGHITLCGSSINKLYLEIKEIKQLLGINHE